MARSSSTTETTMATHGAPTHEAPTHGATVTALKSPQPLSAANSAAPTATEGARGATEPTRRWSKTVPAASSGRKIALARASITTAGSVDLLLRLGAAERQQAVVQQLFDEGQHFVFGGQRVRQPAQDQAVLGVAAQQVANGNIVVSVDVMAKLVAHHKAQFSMAERFQQTRGEHHEEPAVLGLETHRIELGAGKDVKLQRNFQSQQFDTFIGDVVNVWGHSAAQAHGR